MNGLRTCVLAALVVGCGDLSDTDQTDTDTTIPSIPEGSGDGSSAPDSPFEPHTGGVPWNGISWHGMPWHLVTTDALATGDYPADGRVTLDQSHSNGLESTPDGRLVLKYLTQCALPNGATLVYDDGVELHEWPGSLALAPKWVGRPITGQERAWVSACILATVNPTGNHVPFSPRGHHAALEDRLTDDELDVFAYEEAAFYGDIFADPPVAYVCVGEDLSKIETDSVSGPGRPQEPDTAITPQDYLRYRLCAWADCGIEHTGQCFSVAEAHVCTDRPDRVSSHEPCYDSEIWMRQPDQANLYGAVITTYLTAEAAGKFEEEARDGQTP